MPVEPKNDSLKEHNEFFALAERFRTANDPKEVALLGEELGRMVFGQDTPQGRAVC